MGYPVIGNSISFITDLINNQTSTLSNAISGSKSDIISEINNLPIGTKNFARGNTTVASVAIDTTGTAVAALGFTGVAAKMRCRFLGCNHSLVSSNYTRVFGFGCYIYSTTQIMCFVRNTSNAVGTFYIYWEAWEEY